MIKNTKKFLNELADNNNRDWFQANKEQYQAAREEFIEFVSQLIERISAFDDEIQFVKPEECLFRIYRDVRFSKDKTPYKVNFGAYICQGGKKVMSPGYYIHIEPKGSFIAGGMYKPTSKLLAKIRALVSSNFDEFSKIINKKNFKKHFPDIRETDKLKTVPRGFSKDDAAIEYLRLKNFIAVTSIDESQSRLLVSISKKYEALFEFNKFLRKAIK